MATIDDLTAATTALLDAVTSGKANLDLAVDETAANMYAVAADKAIITALASQVSTHKDAASAFATNASNSAVTAGVRAVEADNSADIALTAQTEATTQAALAVAKAAEAVASASDAADSADAAAASALTAFSSPSTNGHSTTSMTMATGSKSFTIETGKYFVPGMSVQVAVTASAGSNWMHGVINSYNQGTGAIVVIVDLLNGSGTFADWTISLSGPIGTNSINLTGVPTAPTAAPGANTTQIATTAFVTTADNLKANLNSPSFTGVPTAPTASAGTNTTQVATTAFVGTAVSNGIKVDKLQEIGNAGTSQTLDTASYDTFTLTCDQATLNLSATSIALGRTVTLVLTGADNCVITWPTGIKWPGGSAPSFSAGADRVVMQRVSATAIHASLAGANYA